MSSRMIAVVSCASWEVVGLADDLARIGATSELVVVGFHGCAVDTCDTWDRDTGNGICCQRCRPSPAFLEDFCGERNQQRMEVGKLVRWYVGKLVTWWWSSWRGRSKDAG